jgi:hypothetical protein
MKHEEARPEPGATFLTCRFTTDVDHGWQCESRVCPTIALSLKSIDFDSYCNYKFYTSIADTKTMSTTVLRFTEHRTGIWSKEPRHQSAPASPGKGR